MKTLPEQKRNPISAIRSKLLSRGYQEEMEYDAINVEPVLTYSKSQNDILFVRFKWELSCSILLTDVQKLSFSFLGSSSISKYLTKDGEDRSWLKYAIPEQESEIFLLLDKMYPIEEKDPKC